MEITVTSHNNIITSYRCMEDNGPGPLGFSPVVELTKMWLFVCPFLSLSLFSPLPFLSLLSSTQKITGAAVRLLTFIFLLFSFFYFFSLFQHLLFSFSFFSAPPFFFNLFPSNFLLLPCAGSPPPYSTPPSCA